MGKDVKNKIIQLANHLQQVGKIYELNQDYDRIIPPQIMYGGIPQVIEIKKILNIYVADTNIQIIMEDKYHNIKMVSIFPTNIIGNDTGICDMNRIVYTTSLRRLRALLYIKATKHFYKQQGYSKHIQSVYQMMAHQLKGAYREFNETNKLPDIKLLSLTHYQANQNYYIQTKLVDNYE